MDLSKLNCMPMFPTNLLSYVWDESDEFNAKLKEIILENTVASNSPISNIQSFGPEDDLMKWDYPEIQELKNRFMNMFRIMTDIYGHDPQKDLSFSLAGWANVMHSTQYTTIHNHAQNHWSGVYYVSTGQPDSSIPFNGHIEFNDPRPGAAMAPHSGGFELSPRYSLDPKEGLMIIFPSFLEHYVHPFIGEDVRISVAVNAKIA